MSDEKELKNQEEVVNDENTSTEEVKKGKTEQEENKEPTWEEKYAELNEKYIRIHAEFDNYRKRTNKEKLDIISTANAGVLKDLLPVIDDFERAIQNNENAEDLTSVKEGFQLIFNKFRTTLEGKGLKAMESNESAFDSDIHEAIANIPAPTKKMKGKVVDTVEKGYYLNDKVIRFAKVVVGQ